MLVIKFQSKMNVEKLEEIVNKHNCTIIIMSNIETTHGSITVCGSKEDLNKLEEIFAN